MVQIKLSTFQLIFPQGLLVLKDKTKKKFLCLKFNMLSYSFLVIQETNCCIVLSDNDFSEVGGYDFSKIGGFGKVAGVDSK